MLLEHKKTISFGDLFRFAGYPSKAIWFPFALLPLLGVCTGWANRPDTPKAAPKASDFEQQIRPLLAKYCLSCHNDHKASSGLNLAAYPDTASIQRNPVIWRGVQTRIQNKTMPPQGSPQPSSDEREALAIWIGHTVSAAPANSAPVVRSPGRVLIHRLSRSEYNNTVHDLLGVSSRPADDFPADGGGGGGFDNNADTLFVPPILMERYLDTASALLTEAKPARLFSARPTTKMPRRTAAEKSVRDFASLAYRHPVEQRDLDRLMHLYDSSIKRGQNWDNSVKLALKATLISPNFLFRIEPDKPGVAESRIGDYELASRLSYLLWSSMPDVELFQLSAQKRLHDPAVLEKQVKRMVASPKSRAFAQSFAGQWLRTKDLDTTVKPDTGKFPAYTPTLRNAMIEETTDFFDTIIREDDSLLHLLDADYTYLNEELAKHYGIEGVQGTAMRRVSLPDHRRGGVLTMGSVLTLTSYAQRTSPVLRGKWVLEEILGAPSPPPPPDAGGLSQNDNPEAGLTFRQRLEKHRSKPQCAGCHSRMDPIGFGLENFDGVGKWRSEIGGKPVDSSGILEGGTKFSGPIELKVHLLEQKQAFIHNLTEKMLAYALGRGLEAYDEPAVRKIEAALAKDGYRSGTLLREVVKSYPFQYRSNK